MPADTRYDVGDLLRVMERLRDPEHGCPWDLAQDFSTIVPSTLEECYELVAAIEHEDYGHVAEELGDVLFQVIFYAQLGREQGRFDFQELVSTLVSKLLRRHPHVFADGDIEAVVKTGSTVQEVRHSWEAIKKQERQDRSEHGILDDIPIALPAISRAQKIQKRAAQHGFDWTQIDAVVEKVEEELREFADASGQGQARLEEEVGDLLFTCVNLARHAGLDAEAALRRATSKFENRFRSMEEQCNALDQEFDDLSADELDSFWRRAKAQE